MAYLLIYFSSVKPLSIRILFSPHWAYQNSQSKSVLPDFLVESMSLLEKELLPYLWAFRSSRDDEVCDVDKGSFVAGGDSGNGRIGKSNKKKD